MSLSIWTTSFFFTLAAFFIVWALHVREKNVGVIDYYWGPGFALSGWLCFFLFGSGSTGSLILLAAVSLWSIRLAWHLIARHRSSTAEDARYKAMRDAGGPSFWWKSLFTIFALQAIIHWLVSAPILLAIEASPTQLSLLFWLGMALFLLGFAVESLADWQLTQFKRQTQENSLCESGLWGLSRHPNYVGEMILWVGLGISAFALTGSFIALISPIFLIVVMSGISVPLTDQHMRSSRANYADYEGNVPRILPSLFGPKSTSMRST